MEKEEKHYNEEVEIAYYYVVQSFNLLTESLCDLVKAHDKRCDYYKRCAEQANKSAE